MAEKRQPTLPSTVLFDQIENVGEKSVEGDEFLVYVIERHFVADLVPARARFEDIAIHIAFSMLYMAGPESTIACKEIHFDQSKG